MDQQITLKADPRQQLGRQVKILRKNGKIPAILYGKNFKSLPLALDKTEFNKIFAQAGTSTLVNLNFEGSDQMKVLIHEPSKNPVSDEILHVDLYKVDMKQEIHTEIPLEFVGGAAAVEELEGNLITNKDALAVKCLPDKLVSEIQVDISALKTFDDLIKVDDLKIPEGIEVLADAEEIVAQVTPPRSEEELKEMEAESASDEEKAKIETMEAAAEQEKAAKEAAETPEEQSAAEPSPKDEKE